MNSSFSVAGAVVAVLCLPALAQDGPPKAAVRIVTDTYHGEKVDDPYRWLERKDEPEARAWLEAQDAHARKYLGALPARTAYRKRLAELEAIPVDTISVFGPVAPAMAGDGSIFYLKRKPGEPQGKLYVRKGPKGAERLLFDAMAGRASGANPRAIAWVAPSPQGRLVAIGVAEGGSERADLLVIEASSGRVVDGPIARTDFASPSWAPDGLGFYYMRLAAGKAEAQRYEDSQARFHRVGSRDDDPIVFGNAHPGSPKVGKAHFPFVVADPGGKALFGVVSRGSEKPYALYMADAGAVAAGKLQWKKLFDFDAGYEFSESDAVNPFVLRAGKLHLLTVRGNRNGSIVAFDPARPEAPAKTIFESKERAISGVGVARDALYLRLQDGPNQRLGRLDAKSGRMSEHALPGTGAVDLGLASPYADGLLFLLGTWTQPGEWFLAAPGSGKPVPVALADTRALRSVADLASEEVEATSHDGTKVPLSLVYRKGLKKDGRNPVLLSGYGAYGVTDAPYFSRSLIAPLERGFVVATCHTRGGGAFGEAWHKGGFKQTKPNTWKDFIACAEWLIANGYTSKAHLAGSGTSAGGILVGRAVTERPDLFAAAIPRVGCLDMLRFETTANGPSNIPEFGTVKAEDEYRALKAMSTYHQIKDGEKYPALLLTHGFNDPRVEVWISAKGAARWQAASASGKPVLLRVDFQSGHGIGSSVDQRLDEQADTYAFLESVLRP